MAMRLAATVAVTGVAASLLVAVPATTASADVLICDPGSRRVEWLTAKRSHALTHNVEIVTKGYSGGSKKFTRTLTHDKTVTSGYSIGGGVAAGFSVTKVLKSLDVNVEGSYTHEKAKTSSRSFTIEDTLTKKGKYVFYRGTVKATGNWRGVRCDRGTKWVDQTYGKARTFSAQEYGTVRCGEKLKKKSFELWVQKRFC